MRKLVIAIAAITSFAGVTAAVAKPSCNVDKAEWQSEQALRDKLAAQKWTIKKIKIDNGCYEVYGTDDKGQRVEIYFNPKSLEAVPGQEG
ncbi:MAG TPA: PepSY domain-containing protein [Hyphomicrobium sp.]|nr:PepSY domain-containing protein [Hyphomicrobium sp.]